MSETIINTYKAAAGNTLIRLVLIAIVTDTIFGVLRAIKEKRFNSCVGINGAIRKIAMILTVLIMVLVDKIVKVNLIGFIPEEARDTIGLTSVGITEFFAILYIAYEVVSILKNMALCGLPVKKVWAGVKKLLGKYTDELPEEAADDAAADEEANENGDTAADDETDNTEVDV